MEVLEPVSYTLTVCIDFTEPCPICDGDAEHSDACAYCDHDAHTEPAE